MSVRSRKAPELAVDVRCQLGESPVWDAERGVLRWVDIRTGTLYSWSRATGDLSTIEVGHALSAVAPRQKGGDVVATRLGFGALDEQGRFSLLAPVEPELPANRMNDGKCDRRGRFWAGTMSEQDKPGAGSVYRLELDGTVVRVFGDVTISNGLDWSPDGATMYYVDTTAGGIDAFDFVEDTGEVSSRRRLVDIDRKLGLADGLTVDEEGGIWLALHSGNAVHRYSRHGELLERVELPTCLVTSCAFGGPDLTELYITTAIHPERREALAGAIFCYEPGVRGLLGRPFQG